MNYTKQMFYLTRSLSTTLNNTDFKRFRNILKIELSLKLISN